MKSIFLTLLALTFNLTPLAVGAEGAKPNVILSETPSQLGPPLSLV